MTESAQPIPEARLASMRVDYHGRLDVQDLDPDPFEQFGRWFEQACQAGFPEPNAMTLATVDSNRCPTTRTVLLKHWDQRGFVFFTNVESRKARQIAGNSEVSLLFPWLPLHRQVSINGPAERVGMAEVVAYFAKRPFAAQVAAWASPQSSVITSRTLLEMKWEEMKRKFREGAVPLPSFWGGYRVVPREIEFWQGGENRLHDRFLYRRSEDQRWKIDRLAP